jgi:hypothetical protein
MMAAKAAEPKSEHNGPAVWWDSAHDVAASIAGRASEGLRPVIAPVRPLRCAKAPEIRANVIFGFDLTHHDSWDDLNELWARSVLFICKITRRHHL